MKDKYVIGFTYADDVYVRKNEDGSWDQIHDLTKATLFDSKNEAEKWMKKETTHSKYAKYVCYPHALKEFENWSKKGMVTRSFQPINKKLSVKYDCSWSIKGRESLEKTSLKKCFEFLKKYRYYQL